MKARDLLDETILKGVPELKDAVGLYRFRNGRVAFYSKGDHVNNDFLLAFIVDDEVEGDPRWLAYKDENGKWIWREGKIAEAVAKLESLGYQWDEKIERWEKIQETVTITDHNGNEQTFLVPEDEA